LEEEYIHFHTVWRIFSNIIFTITYFLQIIFSNIILLLHISCRYQWMWRHWATLCCECYLHQYQRIIQLWMQPWFSREWFHQLFRYVSSIFIVDCNSNIANFYGLLKVVSKSITTLPFWYKYIYFEVVGYLHLLNGFHACILFPVESALHLLPQLFKLHVVLPV